MNLFMPILITECTNFCSFFYVKYRALTLFKWVSALFKSNLMIEIGVKKFFFLFMITFCHLQADNLFDAFIHCAQSQAFLSKLKAYDKALYANTINELKGLRDRYETFKGVETNSFQSHLSEESKIPKIIHLIWLGEKKFHPSSMTCLQSIIRYHPDYQIFFWTDRKRDLCRLPADKKKKICFKHLNEIEKLLNSDLTLKRMFEASLNYGEQSDILRYLILYKLGGIYLDHDVRVFRSFDVLANHLSFFSFTDRLYGMVLNQYVKFSNSVIGSNRGSRIIKEVLNRVKSTWDYWNDIFNQINFSLTEMCNFDISYNKRLYSHSVFLKTFIPFTLAIKSVSLNAHEVILPPQMFLQIKGLSCRHMFARHKSLLSWWQM